MPSFDLTDLDSRPELQRPALELFRACTEGRNHAVCGEPSRMGLAPGAEGLADTLGVLCACEGDSLLGALAICPYSEEQVTAWGPVIDAGNRRRGVASVLLRETRNAIHDGGFQSLRVLVDTRNRVGRTFWLSNGLSPWKNNLVFERDLRRGAGSIPGVSLARTQDHREISRLLMQGFPDSSYCDEALTKRERQGYRHYILQDSGTIVAAAAVRPVHGRAWLNMLTVAPAARGRRFGTHLLEGILHLEAAHGSHRMGLEVLGDNASAIRIYKACGFRRSWSASIMTGPL